MKANFRRGLKPIAGLALVLPLLTACGSLQQSATGINRGLTTAEVAPGGTGSCTYTPCQILFHTPDAAGPVTVLANRSVVGSFPPGSLVSLGSFTDQTVSIRVQGMDLPTAFVHMPSDIR